MQIVTLKGEKVVFPPQCPCCLLQPDGEAVLKKSRGLYLIVVILTRSITLRLPYCLECQRHAKWFGRLGAFGAVLVSLGAAALAGTVALIWRQFELIDGGAPASLNAIVVVVAASAAALVGWLQWRQRPLQPVSEHQHARSGWAVQIQEFGTGRLKLRLHSDVYAARFIQMNGANCERVQ